MRRGPRHYLPFYFEHLVDFNVALNSDELQTERSILIWFGLLKPHQPHLMLFW